MRFPAHNPKRFALSKADLDAVFSMFDSEDACIDHLFHSRWPHGFRCPACGHERAYTITSRRLPLYQCAFCRRQTSLIAGTVMEGSRTPLRKWLIAIQLLSRESSVTAVRLSAWIQVTYKTAWLMLHKIRRAISACDAQEPIFGTVQAGLRYYDRLESIRRQRSFPFIVLGSEAPFQVKMKLAPTRGGEPDLMRPVMLTFFAKHTHASASKPRPSHYRISKELNRLFWEAVSWINQTFSGLATRHMQLYWDEFCYRKNMARRGKDTFAELSRLCMKQAVGSLAQ